jgi:predicted unusual protein kinase regulating ubiquinone biosynthesis (AarF/ABC1/UbiB family)
MEYVQGRKVTELGPLTALEMDGEALADELFKAYMKQILIDGLFHADPHPGNVLVTHDYRIGLIDLGMIGRVTPGMQEQLLKLLIAVGEGRSEDAADVAIKVGETLEEFNESEFRRRVAGLIGQHRSSTVEDIQIGRALIEFTRLSGASGIRMPPELSMLGKALLNLDEIGRKFHPEFNPTEAIRRHAADITRRKLMKSLSPGNLFSAAMEAKELAQEMPARVNRILDLLSRNQLKLEVETIDEDRLIEGFQKVANRITMGLVLASLVVGAALLMRVETRFQIMGYPALAMACFLAAATGGFALVISILLSDRRVKKA